LLWIVSRNLDSRPYFFRSLFRHTRIRNKTFSANPKSEFFATLNKPRGNTGAST
jgi:hypothetical protein